VGWQNEHCGYVVEGRYENSHLGNMDGLWRFRKWGHEVISDYCHIRAIMVKWENQANISTGLNPDFIYIWKTLYCLIFTPCEYIKFSWFTFNSSLSIEFAILCTVSYLQPVHSTKSTTDTGISNALHTKHKHATTKFLTLFPHFKTNNAS